MSFVLHKPKEQLFKLWVFIILVGVLLVSFKFVTQGSSCIRRIKLVWGITLQCAIELAQRLCFHDFFKTRSLTGNGLSIFLFKINFGNFYCIINIITIKWLLYAGPFSDLWVLVARTFLQYLDMQTLVSPGYH